MCIAGVPMKLYPGRAGWFENSVGSRRGWIIILYPRYITLQVQGEVG